MNFVLSYLVVAGIYGLLAISTNLLIGVAGIFAISQGAIFGVGAYIVAVLTTRYGWNFFLTTLLAMACCLLLTILITLPSLRVSGDYFVVASFGIQLVLSAMFENLQPITKGAAGITGVPPPELFGWELSSPPVLLALTLLCLAFTGLVFHLIMSSPFGAILSAIRQDEVATAAIGKNVLQTKVAVAAVAGMLTGIAGPLYAGYLSFIDPNNFDLSASIFIVTLVVLGGVRTLRGSLVGALVLVGLPQLLSLLSIPTSVAAPIRQLLYGALLVLFMLFRPQGLLGKAI